MKIKKNKLIVFLLGILFLFIAYNLITDYNVNFIVIREFVWSQHTYEKRLLKFLKYPDNTFEKEAFQILSKFDSDYYFLKYIKSNKITFETFKPIIPFNVLYDEKKYEFMAQKFMEDKTKSLNLCSTIENSKISDTNNTFSIEYTLKHYTGDVTHWFAVHIYKKINLILWDRCKCL